MEKCTKKNKTKKKIGKTDQSNQFGQGGEQKTTVGWIFLQQKCLYVVKSCGDVSRVAVSQDEIT